MFEELLTRLALKLEQHKIPYIVTGGQAVLLYGEPRLTRDIDLTVGISNKHLDKMIQIAEQLKLKIIPKEIYSFVSDTMVLPVLDEKTGIRIDIVFSFTPYETQAIRRAKKINLNSVLVSFVSLEDLIIHKIFSGRPRDIEDLEIILKKNKNLDLDYTVHWLSEFDKTFKDRNFLGTFRRIFK